MESGEIDSTICFARLRIEMSEAGGPFTTGNTFNDEVDNGKEAKDATDDAANDDDDKDFLGEGMIPLSR
jgi:hypothetical protein